MSRRLIALLTATCAALALAPVGAARAAVAQIIPTLGGPGTGIVASSGAVWVVEAFNGPPLLAAFTTEGYIRTSTMIAGGPGSPKEVEPGPNGRMWISVAGPTPATRGIESFGGWNGPGPETLVPTAFGCGPVALAADVAHGRMLYASPDDGAGCGTTGIGAIDASGASAMPPVSTSSVADLLVLGDKLYATEPGADAIVRYALDAGGIAREAAVATPAGSRPLSMTLGSDGAIYVTLNASGQVARVAPDAPDGSAATVVAGDLVRPSGIAGGPRDALYVASEDSRVQVYPPTGPSWTVALPANFRPRKVLAVDKEVWVLDADDGRLARIVDDAPGAQVYGVNGTTISVTVNPRGNDTRLTATVLRADGRAVATKVSDPVGGALPVNVDLRFAEVPVGDYTVSIASANARGAGPTLTVPLHVAPAPATPRSKPKLAQLVSYASTRRCLATRSLRFALHRRPAAAPTVTRLKVTVGRAKARSYPARRLKKGLTLKGLPAKGAVKVRLVATLSDGTTASKTLAYRRCAPKAKKKA